MDGQTIYNLGMSEVKRIYNGSLAIALKYNSTFEAFLTFLRTSPQFYAKTEDEYISFIRAICKQADAALPELFESLPRCPYGVYTIPQNQAPTAPLAYYYNPDAQCSRPGKYFVNSYNLTERPLYLMQSTSLHESVPGHHLQIATQQELSIPQFRQFGQWNAYIEGWALYSESLGPAMGFYQDDFFLFGSYSDEILRAFRLVVDTGIHLFNMSRNESISFMATQSGLSLTDIEAEVDRYIAMPGQALGYKIGQLQIQELRTNVQMGLGTNFNIRDFHNKVLSLGAGPLSLLKKYIYSIYCPQFTTSQNFCP